MSSGNGVPCSFTQGDSVVFSYSDPNFPSSAWGLKLAMLKAGQPVALPAGVAQSDGSFLFTLPATATAALLPGRYVARLVATATTGGARQSLCTTSVFVSPDLTVGLEPTDAMKILTTLKAGMVNLAKGTISSFSGGGQSWTKKNLKELQEAIDRWQVIVDNELRVLGLSNNGGAKTLLARFC